MSVSERDCVAGGVEGDVHVFLLGARRGATPDGRARPLSASLSFPRSDRLETLHHNRKTPKDAHVVYQPCDATEREKRERARSRPRGWG